MDILLRQNYMVWARLPKREEYDICGAVQMVHAGSQEEAIEKAIQRTPRLLNEIPEGINQFMAVPVRDVPFRLVHVTHKPDIEV